LFHNYIYYASKSLATTNLVQLKKTYNDIKIAHAISPIENPLQIRSLRRSVARIATEISKRELL